MRIVAPSVEIMRTGMEKDFMSAEQFIEKVGRTCYKSEDKITDESAVKFVNGLVKRGHEAMIEHWNLIFKTTVDWYEEITSDWEMLLHNRNIVENTLSEYRAGLRPFLKFTDRTVNGKTNCVISGNMRAWRDYTKACHEGFGFIPSYLHSIIHNYPTFFPEYQDWIPVNVKEKILTPISANSLSMSERRVHQVITVKFTCDRGVSHEIVRHRTASFAQESTRYCNYGLEKFGNEITVVRPSWCDEGSVLYESWKNGCLQSEASYFTMLSEDATPQQARSVLVNSLKTEVIMSADLDCWDHFFFLRCAPDAQPDMREVALMAQELFDGEVYGM